MYCPTCQGGERIWHESWDVAYSMFGASESLAIACSEEKVGKIIAFFDINYCPNCGRELKKKKPRDLDMDEFLKSLHKGEEKELALIEEIERLNIELKKEVEE